jgi:C1A family cysteine protease
MASFLPRGLGWQRDLPDLRDNSPSDVSDLLAPLKPLRKRPAKIDWREFCQAVDDQQGVAAGAAHACVGLLQYCERRSSGRLIEPSRLFVHVTAGKLVHPSEGCASIRTTWKAVIRFGLPPENCFPYEPSAATTEPPPFAYSFRPEVASLRYVRLDDRGQSGEQALANIREWLAAGFTCVFGFPVYTSISEDADVPFPTRFDELRGGQPVLAIGYDDDRRIRSDKGAILIRNSWGPAWGDGGYGWLPYAYVRRQLAGDCWTALKPEWIESDEFQRPGP